MFTLPFALLWSRHLSLSVRLSFVLRMGPRPTHRGRRFLVQPNGIHPLKRFLPHTGLLSQAGIPIWKCAITCARES